MTLSRKYVEVVVLHKLDGSYVPLFVVIGMIKNTVSKVLSTAHHRDVSIRTTQYCVLMNGEKHELYECDGKWWFYL